MPSLPGFGIIASMQEKNQPNHRSSSLPRPQVSRPSQVRQPQPHRPLPSPSGELAAWLAKYEPVERAIIEARERRLESRARRTERRRREFGDLCEFTEGSAVRWRRGGFFPGEAARLLKARDPFYLAYVEWLRRDASRQVEKLRGALRRPLYYERENARRRELAAERRKIRRRSTDNPCPTREQVLDAWTHVKDSHEATVRFGSMLEDLECYLDSSLRRDGNGVIVGRNPGIKGWLQENIPALALRYTTVMRYKAAAKKLRQIVGLADPIPAAAVLADGDKAGSSGKTVPRTRTVRATDKVTSEDATAQVTDKAEPGCNLSRTRAKSKASPDVEVVRARAIWLEVVAGVAANPTALVARIDALVDPERIEDANMLAGWKGKYANEITVRTKYSWWRKMLEKRRTG